MTEPKNGLLELLEYHRWATNLAVKAASFNLGAVHTGPWLEFSQRA